MTKIIIPIDDSKLEETLDIIAVKYYGYSSYQHSLDERIKAKLEEQRYQKDNRGLEKRMRTGDRGELIVCKAIGYEAYPDLSVGHSSEYNHPDIKKLGVGVKCVNAPYAHMINKDINHPQILVTIDGEKAIIHGLFDPQTLRDNFDDLLVKDINARAFKSGFNRYDLGKPISYLFT